MRLDVIAAQQPVYIELEEHPRLFRFGKQRTRQRLFHRITQGPRVYLRNSSDCSSILKSCSFQIADHCAGDPENAGNLVDLELAGFEKLRLFVGDGDGIEVETFSSTAIL
jgi:hypothetical protein